MNRRRGGIQKNLRDYIVPIIGLVLIIILIFSVFSGGSETNTPSTVENKVGLNVSLGGDSSEATIVYPGDYKTEVTEDVSLYKGEKIIVKKGNVNIDFTGIADFNLNKLGELKYLENGDFSLFSGDVWVDTKSNLNMNMRFAKVKIGENSHLSFSQNEMGSTVYLISGFAEVTNLVGESTVLAPSEKITISRIEASKEDLDLSLAKEDLDEFFTRGDWFIKNNGSFFLQSKDNEEDEEKTSTGTTIKSSASKNGFISFDNLADESNVSASTIKITGKIENSEITKIVLNGNDAKINKETKVFVFENVDTSNSENDLVFRVYDDANDILSKFVYTVFYSSAVSTNNTSSAFKVKTYDVDGSQFTFTSPTTKNTLTTYNTFVTIRGKVLAKGIDKVTVNDYKLNSFNGSTWRYHADAKFNNLGEGTNVYAVKYFSGGKLVYTNNYTIIKKTQKVPVKTVEKETEKISGEAQIN